MCCRPLWASRRAVLVLHVTLFRILAVRDVGSARALEAYRKEGERALSPTEKDADGFWLAPVGCPETSSLGPSHIS